MHNCTSKKVNGRVLEEDYLYNALISKDLLKEDEKEFIMGILENIQAVIGFLINEGIQVAIHQKISFSFGGLVYYMVCMKDNKSLGMFAYSDMTGTIKFSLGELKSDFDFVIRPDSKKNILGICKNIAKLISSKISKSKEGFLKQFYTTFRYDERLLFPVIHKGSGSVLYINDKKYKSLKLEPRIFQYVRG